MSVPARDLSFLRVYLCSLDEVLHDFLPDAGAQFGIGAVDVHLGQRDVEVGLALGFVVGLEEPLESNRTAHWPKQPPKRSYCVFGQCRVRARRSVRIAASQNTAAFRSCGTAAQRRPGL